MPIQASHTRNPTDLAAAERHRITLEFRDRLRSRGVSLHLNDSLEELGLMLEAVEGFERTVNGDGGDLIVDEPPVGKVAVPDDPFFAIPVRRADEAPTWFATRVADATHRIQRRRPQG